MGILSPRLLFLSTKEYQDFGNPRTAGCNSWPYCVFEYSWTCHCGLSLVSLAKWRPGLLGIPGWCDLTPVLKGMWNSLSLLLVLFLVFVASEQLGLYSWGSSPLATTGWDCISTNFHVSSGNSGLFRKINPGYLVLTMLGHGAYLRVANPSVLPTPRKFMEHPALLAQSRNKHPPQLFNIISPV